MTDIKNLVDRLRKDYEFRVSIVSLSYRETVSRLPVEAADLIEQLDGRIAEVMTHCRVTEAALESKNEALKGAAVIAEAAGAEIRKLRALLAEVAAVKRYNANKAWPNCMNNFWSMNMPRELLERIDATIKDDACSASSA